MTARNQSSQGPERKARDPDLVGAEAALHRAPKNEPRRAFQTSGKVAVFNNGRVDWENAVGTLTDDPEGLPRLS